MTRMTTAVTGRIIWPWPTRSRGCRYIPPSVTGTESPEARTTMQLPHHREPGKVSHQALLAYQQRDLPE